MARRRPVVLVAASLALVAGAAVTVPAQAAPPTADGEYSAPYSGRAYFGSSLRCADGVTTCTATGSSDATTGKGTTTSSFSRSAPAEGREDAFGYAAQVFTVKTRPGTSSVSATFTWRVDESSVQATSTAGLVQAYTGVVAFASNCGGDCTSETGSAGVQYVGSAAGLPLSETQAAPTDFSVTVTATGKLPRHLNFRAYPYSVAAGDVVEVCPTEDEDDCAMLAKTHAGTAKASITAVLKNVSVTSS